MVSWQLHDSTSTFHLITQVSKIKIKSGGKRIGGNYRQQTKHYIACKADIDKEANQKIHVISTINCTKLSMRRKNNVQEEC